MCRCKGLVMRGHAEGRGRVTAWRVIFPAVLRAIPQVYAYYVLLTNEKMRLREGESFV